jgi:hypothetical protein
MVRRWLVVAAGLFAVAELIDGIVYRVPPGIVFGVVLGLCTWWASRSRVWAPSAVLGVLAAVEFLLVVFVYSRGRIRPPGGGWCCTACCRWPSQWFPGLISSAPCLAGVRVRNNAKRDRCKVHQASASEQHDRTACTLSADQRPERDKIMITFSPGVVSCT